MIMIISMGIPSLQRMFARAQFKAGVVELQTELYQTRLLAMKTGKPYIFRYQVGTNLYEIMPKDVLQQAIFQQNSTSFGNAETGFGNGFSNQNEEFSAGMNSINPQRKLSDDVFALSDDSLQNPYSQTEKSDLEWNFSRDSNSEISNPFSNSQDSKVENLTLDETQNINSENTVQSRITEFGVVSRKNLTRNIIFGLGTISKSTPANLQKEAPLQNGQEIEVDLGSSFVGTLESPSERDAKLEDIWSEPIIFYPNGRTSSAVFFLLSDGPNEFYSEIALRGITGIPRISAISSLPPDDPEFPSVLSQKAIAELYASRNSNEQEASLTESMIFDQDSFEDSTFDSYELSGYIQQNTPMTPAAESTHSDAMSTE